VTGRIQNHWIVIADTILADRCAQFIHRWQCVAVWRCSIRPSHTQINETGTGNMLFEICRATGLRAITAIAVMKQDRCIKNAQRGVFYLLGKLIDTDEIFGVNVRHDKVPLIVSFGQLQRCQKKRFRKISFTSSEKITFDKNEANKGNTEYVLVIQNLSDPIQVTASQKNMTSETTLTDKARVLEGCSGYPNASCVLNTPYTSTTINLILD
jgi:hypothetical protein